MKGILYSFGNHWAPLLLVLVFSPPSFGQLISKYGTIEAGFTLAPSNYFGDVGGNSPGRVLKNNNFSSSNLFAGVHISLYPTEWYAIRLAANYGNISADDALMKTKAGGGGGTLKSRNLNFRSKIHEALAAIELYPTIFLESDPTDHIHKLRPYLLAGIGAFHFNPQGHDPATGEWINLKKLHTEGQGFKEFPDRKYYKLKQINIPLGMGVKIFLTETVSFSGELLYRKTFTDYLDDVSTTYIDKNLFYKRLPRERAIVAERMFDKSANVANREVGEARGNPNKKDSYYSVGFKLSFQLNGQNNLKYMRCPRY